MAIMDEMMRLADWVFLVSDTLLDRGLFNAYLRRCME